MRKKLQWVKAGLTAFVLFHLAVIVLVPNGENYIGAKSTPIFTPYVNFFELANKWSFFAPEPGPPPVFVEYEILDKEGQTIGKGSLPEKKNNFFLRERYNRRLASVEFLVMDQTRTERVMLTYLCDKNPAAHSVRIWRVAYSVPPMEDVVNGKRKIGDEEGLQRVEISHSFCEDRK